jgi:hypothetical protein
MHHLLKWTGLIALSELNFGEVVHASICALMFAAVHVLLRCQERPLTPAEIQDQHRFEVGCRPEDAQGYERAMPYCGHGGGH